MRFACFFVVALLAGCGVLPNPFAADADGPQLPDRFVVLAPEDRQTIGRGLCVRLNAAFSLDCEVVASAGARLDLERTAATPGFIAFAAPDAVADRAAVKRVEAALNRPFMLFARRARRLKDDDDVIGLRIGATPPTLSDFETFMAARGLTETDFEALYEVEEADIQAFASFCADDDAADLPFDVLAATADHPDAAIRALADDKDCRLRPVPFRAETVGAVAARRADRIPVFVAERTLDAYRHRGDRYLTLVERVDLVVSAQTPDAFFADLTAALGAAPNRTLR